MRIQRSTLDFLMISAILGSVIVVTTYFGYGAGTLVILFWVVVILFRLKRSGPSPSNSSGDYAAGSHSNNTHANNTHGANHENDSSDSGSSDGGGGD
jgi:hypothetical protein